MTTEGAKKKYGVVVNEAFELDTAATETLRADIDKAEAGKEAPRYDRGGSIAESVKRCMAETGFELPRPQWESEIHGSVHRLPSDNPRVSGRANADSAGLIATSSMSGTGIRRARRLGTRCGMCRLEKGHDQWRRDHQRKSALGLP